jgi:hypothetical protein
MIPNMRHPAQSLKPFLDWLPGDNLNVLEIGCFAGHGTAEFLRCKKVASVTCVDPWRGGYDSDDTASACDMTEAATEWVKHVMSSRVAKPVHLHIGDVWPVAYFDVIYIDGDHRRESVMRDIDRALLLCPHVVAGHDYGVGKHPGVQQAVDACFEPNTLYHFADTSWAVICD